MLSRKLWEEAKESAEKSLEQSEMIKVQAEMLLKRALKELKNADLHDDKGDKGQG